MSNSNKIKFYESDGQCTQKIIVNKTKRTIKVKSDAGYQDWLKGSTLAKLKDDGSGVKVVLVDMLDEIYLDYAQLDYLRKLLNAWDNHICYKPGNHYE
ncbi:MAG TPA: hypothetical protein PKL04_07470 [Methanofastidiosum sp.]|nr:hypothetical protein [Methanofastidiosum sp.]